MDELRREKKVKLVYILPNYDPDIGSHFFHIYELLDKVSEEIDIYLIIERAKVKPKIDKLKGVYVQRFSLLPLRYLELWAVLFCLKIKGWNRYWVHYSIVAGLAVLDVNFLFGGYKYYWNCGMPWLYKRGIIWENIFKFVMRHSILVTGTDGMRKNYISEYNLKEDKTRVMANWVNTERFSKWIGKKKEAREKLNIQLDKKLVLFVHHLSERKGAHRIVPVAERFKEDKNVLFLITGAGPYGEKLKEEITIKKLSNIRIEGEVSNKLIPMYFAASDVFFMPSDEEGFPRVLLESMAMRIPFVASDVGGVREIVPNSAKQYLIEKADIESYVGQINNILNNASSHDSLLSEFDAQTGKYSSLEAVRCFKQIISDENRVSS